MADTGTRERTAARPPAPSRDPADPVEEGKEQAKETARQTKEKAKQAAHDVKEEARERAQEVKQEAERKADRWTTSAGRQIDSVARALRAAGDSLRDDDQGHLADWSGDAADEVERLGGYLKDEDPGSMVRDLEGLARRNPAAFLGTTFAAGLALGRFLRASEPRGENGAASDGGPSGPSAAPTSTDLPARIPEDTPSASPTGSTTTRRDLRARGPSSTSAPASAKETP